MSDTFTRAEIKQFWAEWLEVNREAERVGDWGILADCYLEDATYGWTFSPDEHFMAEGRDEIRCWAVGTEMEGLEGWHYDYMATVLDEENAMIVGFWKQRSGLLDHEGREYEIRGIGGSWVGVPETRRTARSDSLGSATGSISDRPRTPSSRSRSPERLPTLCWTESPYPAWKCPATTATPTCPRRCGRRGSRRGST